MKLSGQSWGTWTAARRNCTGQTFRKIIRSKEMAFMKQKRLSSLESDACIVGTNGTDHFIPK